MHITRIFLFLIGTGITMLIAANASRIAKNNTPQKPKHTPGLLKSEFIAGSDRNGNTLYKEYSAIPPARQLFPNWLAADSLYERGTPEWERIALHPAMLIDEWELELQQTQRLADEH